MKKAIVFLLLVSFISCKNKKDTPDISGIKADVRIERFDRDFFAIDTNRISQELSFLSAKYPELITIFLQNILGLDSENTLGGVQHFLRLSRSIKDTVADVFKNTDALQKEFEQAFKFVKYYFPKYKEPKIITIVGPVDALAQGSNGPTPDFLSPDFLGISLQFYLGQHFSVYSDPFFVENVAPTYRSRRFSKEYIVPDAMQLIIDDLFPDKSEDKSLVEQMVEKGKRWWLLDKIMPFAADSIKTGYTQQQLDWCNANEGLIWSYIVKHEDLYSINQATIQTYIGEGPFTQGFSQELSPGNMGQWIGWQIVKKYADKNPDMKVEDVMKTEAKKLFDEAKYKPK